MVLGKVVNKNVAKLQDLYINKMHENNKGPLSNAIALQIRPFVISQLNKCLNGSFPEELINFTMDRIYDRIVPKKDIDGVFRCFYYDSRNNSRKPGYDPERTNLGSYIIGVIRWSIKGYFYKENKAYSQLLYNEELENYDREILDEEIKDFNFKVLDFEGDIDIPSIRKMTAWMQLSKDN
jgi:hypothetical protein